MTKALKRGDNQAKLVMWSVVSLALIHILWGAVVRATGSGLGCPDWPLCSGQVIPPFETAAVIEFVHRLLALLLTVGVIWVLVKAWFGQGRMRQVRPTVLVITCLLVAQIVLGAVTVLTELPALLVGSHLTISMLFISATVLGAVQVQNQFAQRAVRSPSGAELPPSPPGFSSWFPARLWSAWRPALPATAS